MEKILIVDDDACIRDVIKMIVAAQGYECHSAANGLEAVEALKHDQFAVVITDMMMPMMDGMQLLKHVNKEYPDTDVLVVTGHSDTFLYSNIINSGGTDYIIKPFEGDELEAKLNRIFRERKLIHGMEREIADRCLVEKNLLLAKQEVEEANQAKDLLINDLYGIMDEMLSNRDHYTFEHALRVAEISKRIGTKLEMSIADLGVMERACFVHDIGKVAIPDDVLLKPGQFDQQDREIMKIHPEFGAKLFARKHHDPRISFIIRHHHERLDGSGYPDGLKGDDLDDMVRIVSVADVYESLVAQRPYKNPMSKDEALAILNLEAVRGTLDGRIISLLSKVLESWNPLDISREMAADYMVDLEIFRRKTYFREPLSDFYNYRYLTFLDDAKLLKSSDTPYYLIITNFLGINNFFKVTGHTTTDQILDEIGQNFHAIVEGFNAKLPGGNGVAKMFRKGFDYLFYVECQSESFDVFLNDIEGQLNQLHSDWKLRSNPFSNRFTHGQSIEKALNELSMGE